MTANPEQTLVLDKLKPTDDAHDDAVSRLAWGIGNCIIVLRCTEVQSIFA